MVNGAIAAAHSVNKEGKTTTICGDCFNKDNNTVFAAYLTYLRSISLTKPGITTNCTSRRGGEDIDSE